MTTPRRVLAGFAVLLAAGRAAAGGCASSLSCLSLCFPLAAAGPRRPFLSRDGCVRA
jgi:hypothetical protein